MKPDTKPNTAYTNQQAALRRALTAGVPPGEVEWQADVRRTGIHRRQRKLELRFRAAWGLEPLTGRKQYRTMDRIQQAVRDGRFPRMDHVTVHQAAGDLVLVTQPYTPGPAGSEFEWSTMDTGRRKEERLWFRVTVIPAAEWGFYYPPGPAGARGSSAGLWVVAFNAIEAPPTPPAPAPPPPAPVIDAESEWPEPPDWL